MRNRIVLKKWIRYSLIGIMLIMVLIGLFKINSKMKQDFVSNCENLGYSHNYCVAHS